MRKPTRQLISVAVAGVLAAVVVYGSWLPLRKSYLYFGALQKVETVQTTAELAALLGAALDAPSPIGQGELLQATVTEVLRLARTPGLPPRVVVELVNFASGRCAPVLGRGRGIGYVQTVYLLGVLDLKAYEKTGNREYLAAAEGLFVQGLAASPDRPQFLRGLLNVYLLAGDTGRAKAMAGKILAFWPDDQVTRDALARYLARSGTAP